MGTRVGAEEHLVETVVEGERQRAVHHVVGPIPQRRLDRRDGEDSLLVSADHGLGGRGRTGGVDEAHRVDGERPAHVVGQPGCCFAIVQLFRGHAWDAVLARGCPRRVVVGHDECGAAVVQSMGQGHSSHLFVQDGEGHADPRGGEGQSRYQNSAPAQGDDHPVTAPQPVGVQRGGQLAAVLGQFGVGEDGVAVGDRGQVGPTVAGRVHEVVQECGALGHRAAPVARGWPPGGATAVRGRTSVPRPRQTATGRSSTAALEALCS